MMTTIVNGVPIRKLVTLTTTREVYDPPATKLLPGTDVWFADDLPDDAAALVPLTEDFDVW